MAKETSKASLTFQRRSSARMTSLMREMLKGGRLRRSTVLNPCVKQQSVCKPATGNLTECIKAEAQSALTMHDKV